MHITNSNKVKIDRFLSQKKMEVINLMIVSYFISIYIIDLLEVNHVLVGVFKELLTIPFLGAQLVFLVFGIILLLKEKRLRFSLVLLAICSSITIGSFFL